MKQKNSTFSKRQQGEIKRRIHCYVQQNICDSIKKIGHFTNVSTS